MDLHASTAELAGEFLKHYPNRSIVWLYYADALGAMARYHEAFVALRRTQALCPRHKLGLVYSRFGHLYKQRGSFRLAERWFRKAIKAAPHDASHYIYLGGVVALAGRLPEALAIHQRSIKCKEGCRDEAYLNLGLVLRALGRFKEARTSLKRAIAIDPNYQEAKTELTDIEHCLKKVRQMKQSMAKAKPNTAAGRMKTSGRKRANRFGHEKTI